MWSLWRNRSGREETAKADAALRKATHNLREVEKRGPEVAQLVEGLKDFRERNGFAEALEELIFSRRGPLNDTGH